MALARNGIASFLREWLDGPYIHTSVRLPKATHSDTARDGSVWRLWELCLSLFTTLRPLISDSTPNIEPSSLVHWKDLLGTFFLWGDGFRGGKLDLVLQDSDELRNTTLADLGAIGIILKTRLSRCLAPSARNEERADIHRQTQDLDIVLGEARAISKDEDLEFEEDSSIDSAFWSAFTTPPDHTDDISDQDCRELHHETVAEELSRIARDLEERIFSLMRLVPSMENTLAQINENPSSSGVPGVDFTVSEPAWPYVSNVQDKFRKAEVKLVNRLGQANWERHTKIIEGLDEHADVYNTGTQGIDTSKSIFMPSSLFHDSGIGSALQTAHSNGAILRSSASRPRDSGRLRVPPTPSSVQKGIPFTCDICGHVLHKIKDRHDWKVHVFADLQPYICTFPSCQDELVTFPTRRSWADHEFGRHRVDKYWNCPECPEELPSTDSWKQHLAQEHDITYPDSDPAYQDAIEIAENTIPQPYENQQCPLCLVFPGHSQRSFINHVGQHMEDIALAALPRKSVSASETDSMSSTHTPNTEQHLRNSYESEVAALAKSTPSLKVAQFRFHYSRPFDEAQNLAASPHDQRPEKCPLGTCAKAFARKFDKNRHTLTHFQGTLICRFCPRFGSARLKRFTRVDLFKGHLVSVHGAGVGRNISQQTKYKGKATVASVKCSTCHLTFNDAQTFYKHLDECILRVIERRYVDKGTRNNDPLSQSTKPETHGRREPSVGGPSSGIACPDPKSRGRHPRSRLWSHNIPLGRDGLYHCPWEKSVICSHDPVSLRHDLHKYIDEHRKPYRCVNRLCGDVRFRSKAGLRRHERKMHFWHIHDYEYRTYICPFESCTETAADVIFVRSSDLRDHLVRQHNGSNLPYWSDSSSSSQSPDPMDALDTHDKELWDDWFNNALNQSDFQVTAQGAEDTSQMTTRPYQQQLLLPNPSSFPSSSNDDELFDHLDFPVASPAQTSWPASLNMNSAPGSIFNPMVTPATTLRALGRASISQTGLSSAIPINTCGTKQGAVPTNSSPHGVTPNRQQSASRQRPLERVSPQARRSLKNKETEEESGPIGGDNYGVSDPDSYPPKKKIRRGKPDSAQLGPNDDPFVPQSFLDMIHAPQDQADLSFQSSSFDTMTYEMSFDMDSTPDASRGQLSQDESHLQRNFQCPRCRRKYRTEDKLSRHQRTHRHTHQCTYRGCYLTFDPIKDFNRHVQTHNQQRERFYCLHEDCEYTFSRADNLARHVRAFHNGEDGPGEDATS